MKNAIARWQESFPPGLKVEVAFETTTFVDIAIADVKDNTTEAILHAIIGRGGQVRFLTDYDDFSVGNCWLYPKLNREKGKWSRMKRSYMIEKSWQQ
jgi:hypothetical protein